MFRLLYLRPSKLSCKDLPDVSLWSSSNGVANVVPAGMTIPSLNAKSFRAKRSNVTTIVSPRGAAALQSKYKKGLKVSLTVPKWLHTAALSQKTIQLRHLPESLLLEVFVGPLPFDLFSQFRSVLRLARQRI